MIQWRMQKLIILDYDNTIAKSKEAPGEKMIETISSLLHRNKVGILTAGRSIKGLRDLLISSSELNNPDLLKNLLLCTKYGNLILEYENGWFVLYEAPNIPTRKKRRIERIIRRVPWKLYTPRSDSKQRIHDKGSVISVNCLGNESTDLEKDSWDIDGSVRENIKKELIKKLGDEYEIFITGRNTIDLVPRGMNKADNIVKLSELTSIPLQNCIYIGDEFTPHGNDYPILSLGIKVHQINNPSETEDILKRYV
jgi:hypothetical protein